MVLVTEETAESVRRGGYRCKAGGSGRLQSWQRRETRRGRYIAWMGVRAAQSQRARLNQAPRCLGLMFFLGLSKAAVFCLPDAFEEKVLPFHKGRGQRDCWVFLTI